MRIKLLAHCNHLKHLLQSYDSVSSLPEQNTWAVTVKNHCGTHYLCTLFPLTTCNKPFFIACRAYLDYSIFVTCFSICTLGCYMHPSDIVGIAFAYHSSVKIVHPIGIGSAQTGQVVGRALCITFEPKKFTIEIDSSCTCPTSEFSLAEACLNLTNIHNITINTKHGVYPIKVWIFYIPETDICQCAGGC